MKKPTQEIERMRRYAVGGKCWEDVVDDCIAILAYLDAWPADLTRERLEELATDINTRGSMDVRSDALRRLAELAPRKEKRKVEIYRYDAPTCVHRSNGDLRIVSDTDPEPVQPWRKVGECEVDA